MREGGERALPSRPAAAFHFIAEGAARQGGRRIKNTEERRGREGERERGRDLKREHHGGRTRKTINLEWIQMGSGRTRLTD